MRLAWHRRDHELVHVDRLAHHDRKLDHANATIASLRATVGKQARAIDELKADNAELRARLVNHGAAS